MPPFLWAAGQTASRTGQSGYMLNRCHAMHEDGRVFDWRALVPHSCVSAHQRTTRLRIDRDGRGAVGKRRARLAEHCEMLPDELDRLLGPVGLKNGARSPSPSLLRSLRDAIASSSPSPRHRRCRRTL